MYPFEHAFVLRLVLDSLPGSFLSYALSLDDQHGQRGVWSRSTLVRAWFSRVGDRLSTESQVWDVDAIVHTWPIWAISFFTDTSISGPYVDGN